MNRSLVELVQGEGGRIVRVEGGHAVRYRLRNLGLVEGTTVRKLSDIAWGGPVVVEVNRAQIAIGKGMARRVFVEG